MQEIKSSNLPRVQKPTNNNVPSTSKPPFTWTADQYSNKDQRESTTNPIRLGYRRNPTRSKTKRSIMKSNAVVN